MSRLRALCPQAIGVALTLAWAVLHWPTLQWLVRSLPTEDYSTSLVLLLAVASVAAHRSVKAIRAKTVSLELQPALGPSVLLALASAAFVFQEATFGSDLVGAALTGLSAFGLVGHFVPPAVWRGGLPVTLLAIACLPLGHFANAYLGFSTRVVTAGIVERMLSSLGIASASRDSVLLLETRSMNIDLPCSGIRSAWTGLVLFLAVTCVQRVRLSPRWAVIGLGYAAALFFGNVVRVFVLALVAGHPAAADLAPLIHEPLGVASFVGASALMVAALRWFAPQRADEPLERRPLVRASVAAGVALAAALVALTVARHPLESTERPAPAPLMLPEEIGSEPLALSPAEADLFSRHGALATKATLRWRDRTGSLLVVHSSSWRAHHPPDHCLRGGGHRIDSDLPVALPGELHARVLSIDEGRATAVSWFQSPAGTLNDFARRIAAEVSGERRWALVTLVLDGPVARMDDVTPLALALRGAVSKTFPGEQP